MKSVLVPIDGSPPAFRALSLAQKEVGGVADAALHLLNVQPAAVADWNQRGLDVLAQARNMTLGARAKVELHVRSGVPPAEIISCTRELGCDAILMGTRGLGAPAAAMLGSVALEVARQSPVPVTLVR